MKHFSNPDTTASPKPDYFELVRTSEPIESYGIKEFWKKIEAARKKKSQKSGNT